jgi:hypothetical protein
MGISTITPAERQAVRTAFDTPTEAMSAEQRRLLSEATATVGSGWSPPLADVRPPLLIQGLLRLESDYRRFRVDLGRLMRSAKEQPGRLTQEDCRRLLEILRADAGS